ncbi:MAG: hypothetical protein ACJA0Q_000845 [Saprospiraceae bacterium]|jgi:hypothetical protein
MKFLCYFSILLTAYSCSSSKEIDARWARDKNVAAKLQGKVIVYTIFVDSKKTIPWSGFDIKSTKDSLEKVFSWIRFESKKYDKDILIEPVYATLNSKQTIKKKIPYSSLSTAFSDGDYSKVSKLGKWANGIAKKFEKSIKISGDPLPKKPKLDAFQKLVAKIKRNYNADNVVIFFMLNNYYISDVSAVLNNMHSTEVEFAVNSGKNVNLFAAQFLSLFGAQNLNESAYSSHEIEKLSLAKNDFPNDVMLNYKSDLFNVNIGEHTAYLIGWRDKVNPKYADLFKLSPRKKKKSEKFK